MADRLVFHIGTPKSGTTYLQSVLTANGDALLDAGVLVPGAGQASRTRLRTEIVAGLDGLEEPLLDRVLTRAADHPGPVVISEEWLVLARPDAVAALLRRCGSTPVEVVVTARALTRVVPGAWQELMKLGRDHGLDEFVGRLERRRARWSWATLDPFEAVQPWAEHLPADRIRVVVAPGAGREPGELWRLFCEAVAIPADAATLGAANPNETLGAVAARLMQHIGPVLDAAVIRPDEGLRARYAWLQRYVSHDVLRALPREPIALRPADHAGVRARAAASARSIRDAGWTVTGDLDDLVGPAEPHGRHPDSVTPEELLDAAGIVAARLLADVRAARESSVGGPGAAKAV